MELKVISRSPEETKNLGKLLAKYLKPGDLVLFYGDLGSGKTTLIQGISEGLEVDPEVYITSPTFSLINLYEGRYPLFHLDLYRLASEDLHELGIWEYLSSGILLIEWADRLNQIPGEDFLEIHISYADDKSREITLIGYGQWSELLKALIKDLEQSEEE